jgi:hypothetical protein
MSDTTKTAIITAILTGLFTILAGLATYWISMKDPELSYTVVGGPTLTAAAGVKRIFVVEVRNSGKKEILQTHVIVSLTGGELSEVATEASPGVKLTEERDKKQISLSADLLNPADLVKVSFLSELPTFVAGPRVVVRAAGVKAIDDSKKSDDLLTGNGSQTLWLLIASAMAAVLSSFVLMATRNQKSRGTPIHQSEMTAYICGQCQLKEEADHLRFGGPKISYRGTADYLLHRAKLAIPSDRRKYETALKVLLTNKRLAKPSVDTIRFAISEISGHVLTDSEYETIMKLSIGEEKDAVGWRKMVSTYVNSQLSVS